MIYASLIAFTGWMLALYYWRAAKGWQEAFDTVYALRNTAVVPILGSTTGDTYSVSAYCDECDSPVDIVVIASPGRVIGVTNGGVN